MTTDVFNDVFFTSGSIKWIVLYAVVSIFALLTTTGLIYMCHTLCNLREKCCVDLEKKDDNPDYGEYYYWDGDRRKDVMEVGFDTIDNYQLKI